MTYCKHRPVFCECQPDEGTPCPYEPPAMDDLVRELRNPPGGYISDLLKRAADMIERQAREIVAAQADARGWEQQSDMHATDAAQYLAERDALREVVKAADAMRKHLPRGAFDRTPEVTACDAYDAARAKVQP